MRLGAKHTTTELETKGREEGACWLVYVCAIVCVSATTALYRLHTATENAKRSTPIQGEEKEKKGEVKQGDQGKQSGVPP